MTMAPAPILLVALAVSGALAWYAQKAELVNGDELVAGLEDLVGMSPDAAELAAIAAEPNVAAFLRMIRAGEGTAGPNGYRTMFGGELFATFADHPRIAVTRPLGGTVLTSTAAGAYQFLSRTWDEVRDALGLESFDPTMQDVGAVFLIRRRGALNDVREGRFDEAVRKCGKEWASLPGSPYGQPTKTIDQARGVYAAAGGAFA